MNTAKAHRRKLTSVKEQSKMGFVNTTQALIPTVLPVNFVEMEFVRFVRVPIGVPKIATNLTVEL